MTKPPNSYPPHLLGPILLAALLMIAMVVAGCGCQNPMTVPMNKLPSAQPSINYVFPPPPLGPAPGHYRKLTQEERRNSQP